MKTPEEKLELVDVAFCLPVVLILNFSLFQYLVTTFWRRRHERRVRLLLCIALVSFVSLVPFAFPDKELIRDLNDISEVCSVLTFLLQITILARDVGKRIKIRSIWVLLWVGETLVMVSMAILIANVVDIFAPVINMDVVEQLDDVVENVSLLFIVGFRFYFLAMIKGYRRVWVTQKTEIVCYLLLLTHEYPFNVLTHVTGWSWEHVQGLWMRITITACLWMTVKAKITSQSSKMALTTTNGPRQSKFDDDWSSPRKGKVSVVGQPATTPPPRRSLVAVAPDATQKRTTSPVLDTVVHRLH